MVTVLPQFQHLGSTAASRPSTSQDAQYQCATTRRGIVAFLSDLGATLFRGTSGLPTR
jgi:hypothetical protein